MPKVENMCPYVTSDIICSARHWMRRRFTLYMMRSPFFLLVGSMCVYSWLYLFCFLLWIPLNERFKDSSWILLMLSCSILFYSLMAPIIFSFQFISSFNFVSPATCLLWIAGLYYSCLVFGRAMDMGWPAPLGDRFCSGFDGFMAGMGDAGHAHHQAHGSNWLAHVSFWRRVHLVQCPSEPFLCNRKPKG